MSDNKKYYYMRLREDFFNSPELRTIEKMRGGYKYSNILLKFYLLSLRENGRLSLNKNVPYDVEMLANLTGFSKIEVENALKIFRKFELIEVLDTGIIYMSKIQSLIGKSSTEADRVRKYRGQIENEKENVETISQKGNDKCNNKCTPDKTGKAYKRTPEREIEIRERDRDKDIINNIFPELPKNTAQETGEMPVVSLVLNDKSEYPIFEKQVSEWGKLYPAVDVIQELRKMAGWLNANPKKRKTKNGVLRFVNNWLSREQDSGRNKNKGGGYDLGDYQSL